MRTLSLVVMLAAACFAQAPTFQDMVKDAKTRIKEMSAEQLKAATESKEKLVLIDVREESEWAAGHAAAAVLIPRGVLEARIASKAPDKAAKIVLYCAGGFRSALATDTLQKMGYTDVYSLAGGFGAYSKAGLPVETPAGK